MKVLLIFLAVFFAEISHTQADMLFDFQMKLAKKGNVEAQFKIGEMYETGFGVDKNMDEAMNWISKAAKQGHETAEFKLLYWEIRNNGVTPETRADVNKLKLLANTGNPQAQYYLGMMYAHGAGLKKDTDKGLKWLSKAALFGVLGAESERDLLRETNKKNEIEKQRKIKQRKARALAEREKEQKKTEEQKRLKQERGIYEAEKQKAKKIAKDKPQIIKPQLEANKKKSSDTKKKEAIPPVVKNKNIKKAPMPPVNVTNPKSVKPPADSIDEFGDTGALPTKKISKEEKEARRLERKKKYEALKKARTERELKRNAK